MREIKLKPREKEVLIAASNGKTTNEMAKKIGVSVKSIEQTRTHILIRLNSRNMTEAVAVALRNGLID